MKNKKLVYYILSRFIFLLIVGLLIYLSTFIQPKIAFNAEISKISDEDYKRILNNAQVMYQDRSIDKFRHINIHLKVTTPFGLINHVKVEKDRLNQYLQGNADVQDLSGGSFEQGDGKEYGENAELYLIDIPDYKLRDALGDLKVKVTWKNIWNKSNEKIFYLRDYLK